MMKRLSKLQKQIIQLAHRNKGSVLARNVLVGAYGFLTITDIEAAKPGALVFNRKLIGPKRYQAASVAVARSFNRLAARGLVQRQYNRGITLTGQGVQVAKGLTPET